MVCVVACTCTLGVYMSHSQPPGLRARPLFKVPGHTSRVLRAPQLTFEHGSALSHPIDEVLWLNHFLVLPGDRVPLKTQQGTRTFPNMNNEHDE